MAEPTLSEKLRTGNLFAEQCPSRDVLKHVTSRWGVLILVALREGTHRFSDLRRKMGGSAKRCWRSAAGAGAGWFYRSRLLSGGAPHVEYSLTPLGLQVSEKVAARRTGSRLICPRCWLTTGSENVSLPVAPVSAAPPGNRHYLLKSS